MALDIQINEETIDKISDNIVEVAVEATEEKLEEDVDPVLKQAAETFKSAYDEYTLWASGMRDLYRNYTNALRRLKNAKKSDPQNSDRIEALKQEVDVELNNLKSQDNYTLMQSQIREKGMPITQAQLNFQQQLNNILGQKMRTVFVTDVEKSPNGGYIGGEIFYFDTDEIAQYLNYRWDTASQDIKANYAKTKNLQKSLTRIDILSKDKTLIRYNSKGMSNLRWTRHSAECRWAIAKQKGVVYQGTQKKAAIMWHEPPTSQEWIHVWVDGISVITEAYAAVVIRDQEKDFSYDNNIHALLSIFKPFLLEVDNAPGVIVGDTSREDEEEGIVQVAIKDLDGQVLGLTQFYTEYAQPILEQTDVFNKTKLKAKYDEIKNNPRIGHKAIAGTVEDIAQGHLEELIEALNNMNE